MDNIQIGWFGQGRIGIPIAHLSNCICKNGNTVFVRVFHGIGLSRPSYFPVSPAFPGSNAYLANELIHMAIFSTSSWGIFGIGGIGVA